MNRIETINIWKRSHDGRFSICILKQLSNDTFSRTKETFDSLADVIRYLTKEGKDVSSTIGDRET